MHKPSINEKEQSLLNGLREIVNFGGQWFADHPILINSLNPKQTVLYLMFASVNSYSEAIYILCSDLRPLPATVLVRPLVEAFINSRFILGHNSDYRLWLFSLDDTYDKLGLMEELKKYKQRYPDHVDDNVEKIIQGSQVPIKELRDYSQNLGISFKSKKEFIKVYGSLRSRAIRADRRSKKGEFEYIYLLAYRYLSSFSHLSMSGINSFIEKGIDNDIKINASQSGDLIIVLKTTYVIYHYFLFEMKKRGLMDKDVSLNKFQKFWVDNFQ